MGPLQQKLKSLEHQPISKNIDSLLATLVSKTPSQGFTNTTSSSYSKLERQCLRSCSIYAKETSAAPIAPTASKTLPRKTVKSVQTNLTQKSYTTSASYVTSKRIFHREARHWCWFYILQRS
ncbi:hypothetical protein HID58_031846 [Brassica napus]|uniref:Uncharacterized protein n=1 Tax=Brassica napus TaxID=3708 RepID=A0ABQ8BUN9_BRANA|nr:hypothetical protein HID58_031846 [Brassica napus]